MWYNSQPKLCGVLNRLDAGKKNPKKCCGEEEEFDAVRCPDVPVQLDEAYECGVGDVCLTC